MENCIFCKISSGEVKAEKVYEDDEVLAFRDANPTAPVHVLVIPRKHVLDNLAMATDDDGVILGKLQTAAGKVAKLAGIEEAFQYKTNSGEGAGQTVKHLHYHLQGGWEGGRK